MAGHINRRTFLRSATAATAALASPGLGQAAQVKSGPINVALIGAGAQGEMLLSACIKMGPDAQVRFQAVCDIWENLSLRRVADLLGRYGHEVNSYVDYREMLDKEKGLDAAIIATPDFCHAEQTIACLKAGLHVYCEAPMANTLDGAGKMVPAARETGKLLQIGLQRRSHPVYRHCYENLVGGAKILGKVAAVNAQCNMPARADRGWSKRRPVDEAVLKRYGYGSMHQFRNWMWYKGLGAGPVADHGGSSPPSGWPLTATSSVTCPATSSRRSLTVGFSIDSPRMIRLTSSTSRVSYFSRASATRSR